MAPAAQPSSVNGMRRTFERNPESRAGHRDDHIDLIGLQARALQALFRGFPAELDGMLDVFVVGLREWTRLDGVVEREDSVPIVNLGVIDDAHHRFETADRKSVV